MIDPRPYRRYWRPCGRHRWRGGKTWGRFQAAISCGQSILLTDFFNVGNLATALLHTRDMEKTVRALGAQYGRVLVRTRTDLENPIRLRRGKIADLEPRVVLNDPSFDSQLQDWELNGGILLYERPFVKQVRAHHAQLFVECPLSIEELEYKMQATHDVAVIYRPPRWDEHRRDVAERFPTADLCQKFFKICTQCTTDVPLQGALEVSFQHLNRIRYTL